MLRRRMSFFAKKSHSVENYSLTKLRARTQIHSLYHSGGVCDAELAVRSTGCLLDIQDSVLTKKTALKRSNSMDDASRSSTLKANIPIPDDPDLDVSDENQPWSTRYTLDESMSKKEIKRQDVIAEFIHTERTYLRNLLLLKRAYQEPLLSSNLITASISNRIFLNLTELIDLHRKFKDDVVKLPKPPNNMVTDVANCIADFFDQPALTEEIIKYCTNLQDSLSVLKERVRNSDFATFLIECESNRIVRRKHLKELLPNPMQRITKYPLLIAQIQKYTEPGSSEYDSITYCLEKIRDICTNVNKEVAKASSDRVEKSARGWMLARNKSMSLEIGECRMNVPVFCDDIKQYVNLVMYDKFIVLFPNARSILYNSTNPSSSTSSENQINVRYIELANGNLVVSNDKQEPRSFYLISVAKPEPIITPIICNSDEECNVIFETLKRASTNTEDTFHPKVELIDLKIAENLIKNRPAPPPDEGERQSCEIDERGRDTQLQSSSSPEGSTVTSTEHQYILAQSSNEENECSTIAQRISQIDSQILTLLTTKLDIMTEQSKSRKLPAGARDITQSVTQLTSDADTLHEVAIELLENYRGEDKNGKLTKIRGSYQSMLANINVVCGGYLSATVPVSPLVGDLQCDDKTRRHSIVDRIRHVWKGRDQDQPPNLSEGSVVVRRNKNRSRANTSSPAGLRPSPRSSTESLNKVNCNRHSGCSHYSTDSDTADCNVERVQKRPLTTAVSQATPRSSNKQPSNRRDQAKSTAFDNLFRLRGQPADAYERPVITGPVLQHTTNKQISASDLPQS